MRLFIGLDVPYEMRRNLELVLQLLKPTAQISWSPLSNLHITNRFIGEWPEARLEELGSALLGVPRPGELRISIRGIGWYPNPHHPRVLYAGISAPEALTQLARDTDAACCTIGMAREVRDFRPHLTLARIKGAADLVALRAAIASLPTADFGTYSAAQYHLYESKLSPSGSVYTKLASYPLTTS